jgi:hypothetical protein
MSGSQNENISVLLKLYQSPYTVFKLRDVALITGIDNKDSLISKMNYYVATAKLVRLRKGIYAKTNYSKEELACKVYTPSYISLEYVLQRAGLSFQYDSSINIVSYLSRTLLIDGQTYTLQKLKPEILINNEGLEYKEPGIWIAGTERALLDYMYLNPGAWFDNLNSINIKLLEEISTVYQSKALNKRINKLLKTNGYK